MRKIILIFLFLIILFYLMYFIFIITAETNEIDIYLTVEKENIMGFNTNNTALFFGAIPQGGIGGREITISNTDNLQFIHISSSGNVSSWIMVSENNFFINKNEQKNITVKVFIPTDAELGNYTGKLKIDVKRFI